MYVYRVRHRIDKGKAEGWIDPLRPLLAFMVYGELGGELMLLPTHQLHITHLKEAEVEGNMVMDGCNGDDGGDDDDDDESRTPAKDLKKKVNGPLHP
jgi:hypothetical protein